MCSFFAYYSENDKNGKWGTPNGCDTLGFVGLDWEGIVVMGIIGKVGIFWYVVNYVDKYTLCGVV